MTTYAFDQNANGEKVQKFVPVDDSGNYSPLGGGGESASTTGTETAVNSNAGNVTLLAANSSRKGAIIVNTDEYVLYIKYGATATAAIGGFSYAIPGGATWEMGTLYTGIIDGIWDQDGSGGASITELT
jgi:hypothetical protein